MDTLERIAAAKAELGLVADALSSASKRDDREHLARRLRAVVASLRTVELTIEAQA